MTQPNSDKAKKLKVLEDKVETLGNAFTTMFKEHEENKRVLHEIGQALNMVIKTLNEKGYFDHLNMDEEKKDGEE